MKRLLQLLAIILTPFAIGLSLSDDKVHGTSPLQELPNPEFLDGPFTGGFGEDSCHSCHFDYGLNMDGGSLTVKGFDKKYTPGETYQIELTLGAEQLEIGGFQLTTRFIDGSQAGSFSWEGGRLRYTPSIDSDVRYLQHSKEGTKPTADRKISWLFTWTAPYRSNGAVEVHIAANSGNYDDSSFGDWIYTKNITISPKE